MKIVRIYFDNFTEIRQKNRGPVKVQRQLKLLGGDIKQKRRRGVGSEFFHFELVNVLPFDLD